MSLSNAIRYHVMPLGPLMTYRDFRTTRRTPANVPGTTMLDGHPVAYADGNAFLYSVGEIFRDEVYRFKARNDTPHIIDAGANIGLSVIYFKRLYPGASVIAYEPDTTVVDVLRRNVAHFSDVEVRQAAAWIEDTELTFHTDARLAGSLGLDYWQDGKTITVKAERLREELAKRPVDFLKIDIEGAENEVMFDIEDQLEQVDNLFFEYHSDVAKPQRLGDLLNLVTRNGFRYTIGGAHGAALPFVAPTTYGYDAQLNISCVRTQ